MIAIFVDELKYYFKNLKEVIQINSFFISICLLYPFAHKAGEVALQQHASSILWIALTVSVALGAMSLFSRDHVSGRLEYYQLAKGRFSGVILMKWMAYYVFITMPLVLILPVVALLVDIPVSALPHYGIGLAAGAMALSLLSTLIALMTVGLEKAGGMISLLLLPLSVPLVIFGTDYLASEALITPSLLFLLGFSLVCLVALLWIGPSCARAAN